MHTSAPLPSVSARTASTGSDFDAFDRVGRAELLRPLELLRVEVDGDDAARAGEARPRDRRVPDAAAAEHRDRVAAPDVAGEHGGAEPGHDATAEQPGRLGPRRESTLVAWPAATSVFSANAPIPSAGDSSVPSESVIFCVALNVEKQCHGRPRRQDRQVPHTARQFRITKSPGSTPVTSSPVASTIPAASWPRRNGKSSLIAPSR